MTSRSSQSSEAISASPIEAGLRMLAMRSYKVLAQYKRLLATSLLAIILASLTSVGLVSNAGFFFSVANKLGGRLHMPQAGSQSAVAPTPPQPPASCSNKLPATGGGPFASCPSFLVDFSTPSQGTFPNDYFNVYTGKPEANGEAQLYTDSPKNIRIADGSLQLKAISNPQNGYKYTSARIDTKGKKDFLYGRIIIRAIIPTGTGTWPAIWMLSTSEKYRSFNPAYSPDHDLADGEIDIVEAVGTEPGVVYGIAHSLAYPADGRGDYFRTVSVPGNNKAFHDYQLDWTPGSLTFMVDGKPFYVVTKMAGADYRTWPYDQPYYLILNLALGGSWGGRDRVNFPTDGVDPGALPATMSIQSIKYYPYAK